MWPSGPPVKWETPVRTTSRVPSGVFPTRVCDRGRVELSGPQSTAPGAGGRKGEARPTSRGGGAVPSTSLSSAHPLTRRVRPVGAVSATKTSWSAVLAETETLTKSNKHHVLLLLPFSLSVTVSRAGFRGPVLVLLRNVRTDTESPPQVPCRPNVSWTVHVHPPTFGASRCR